MAATSSPSLDLNLPVWDAFASVLKDLKQSMASLPIHSLTADSFNKEAFRQMVVAVATQSNLSIKQFSPVVVDLATNHIDLVLSLGGFSLVVDLSYVPINKFKDLSHKIVAGSKKLDSSDSLVH
ncbi:UNVERIFIED_CONTAM: hypothetical protein HDU68_005144 [Siphonaria sp. JEL0065]|nr:hypothetical protein HDU68_005144 [Siphonaria sp. JEL0065]